MNQSYCRSGFAERCTENAVETYGGKEIIQNTIDVLPMSNHIQNDNSREDITSFFSLRGGEATRVN